MLAQHPGDDENAHKLEKQWGGLTPLIFATRQGDLDTVKVLLAAKADVNETSEFGWTPLLVATRTGTTSSACTCSTTAPTPTSRTRVAGVRFISPPITATSRAADYPTRKPDMGHLEYIKRLLAAGADTNLRMRSSTETRTVFTHQWLFEDGATPFLRALSPVISC